MRILVVQMAFLGDVALATPVIEKLSRHFAGARIDLLTTPLASSLFRSDPRIAEVIAFDKRNQDRGLFGLIRVARELERRKYDIVFSLHKSLRTALLLRLAKIPKRIGFEESSGAFFYTTRVSQLGFNHAVIRNLAILEGIDCNATDVPIPLSLNFSNDQQTAANELLVSSGWNGDSPIVTLLPSSAWVTKRWPIGYFGELASRLLDRGIQPVVVAGGDEQALTQQIVQACPGAIDLTGKASLPITYGVFAQSKCVVSNDSGPMHIAAAAGVPIVAIFCATSPEFGFTPWMARHEILGVEGLPCRPCGRHGSNICPTGTHACRYGVTVRRVEEAVRLMIEDPPQASIDTRSSFCPSGIPESDRCEILLTLQSKPGQSIPRMQLLDGGRGGAYRRVLKDGRRVVVRKYHRGGLIKRLSRDYFFSIFSKQSRSEREFNILQFLHSNQFPVPRPIATVTLRQGWGAYRTAIVMDEIVQSETLERIIRQPGSEMDKQIDNLCFDAGVLARKLVSLGVFHPDLHPGNILVRDRDLWIIDFDRAEFLRGTDSQKRCLQTLLSRWQRYLAKYKIPLRYVDQFERGLSDMGNNEYYAYQTERRLAVKTN